MYHDDAFFSKYTTLYQNRIGKRNMFNLNVFKKDWDLKLAKKLSNDSLKVQKKGMAHFPTKKHLSA